MAIGNFNYKKGESLTQFKSCMDTGCACQLRSEFFQRVKTIVDDNLGTLRTLDETNPLFSLIWTGTKVAVGGIGTIICGVATVASIEFPPLAGFFGACTLGAIGLFGTSLDEYFNIANSVRAYERRTEEDRHAIEGIFREIEAATSP